MPKKIVSFFSKFLFLLLFLPLITLTIAPNTSAQGPATGPTDEKLAVTPRGFDDIGEVLDNLGFSTTEINEADLNNLSDLSKYDSVYINCSASIDSVSSTAASIIADYVKDGGIIYASDYANSVIEAAFPGKINFYRSNSSTETTSSALAQQARVGNSGKVTATVTDSGLASVLGKKEIEVNYDLGAWAVIDSVANGVKVHIRGPVNIFDYSASAVNLEAYQDIDYSDPKSLEEIQKLNESISESTQKTLKDKPFIVSFTHGKGEVLYTTFHNEAQKTEDMGKVLDWFAVKVKAGKLVQSTRQHAIQAGGKVLQEVVDSINQGEKKTYKFSATGKADFDITLNFGGSELNLVVIDPNGNKVLDQKVPNPPHSQTINNTIAGEYTIEVTGNEVPKKNYPFVAIVSGPEEAAANPILDTDTATSSAATDTDTDTAKESNNLVDKLKDNMVVVTIVVIIILGALATVILFIRKKKAVPSQPQSK